MAFSLRHLNVQIYANGYTHWYYKPDCNDYEQIIKPQSDYFVLGGADGVIAPGDTITISCKSFAFQAVFFGEGRKLYIVPLTAIAHAKQF